MNSTQKKPFFTSLLLTILKIQPLKVNIIDQSRYSYCKLSWRKKN